MKFRKSLAIYYELWYKDCLDSIAYLENNDAFDRAKSYRESAENYRKIIEENKEAIDFFKQGNNAFIKDSALPEKFRGYE